jgi:protein-L-isoaspartate(D-aspartate) O-methyltransferase
MRYLDGQQTPSVNHNLYLGGKVRTLSPANPGFDSTHSPMSMPTPLATHVELARQQMIDQQVRTWDVLDAGVLDVLRQVHRDDFVPYPLRNVAFADSNVPIGHDQLMLAPKIDGKILQALAVTHSDQVLDVGTGTGFLAACLGRLGARVRSLEIFPDLAELAAVNLHKAATNNVAVEVADALTLTDDARYDVIAVTGSLPVIGELADNPFARALKVGGRLFVVVGQAPVMQAIKFTRTGTNEWQREELFETVIPALVNAAQPSRFAF